MRASFPLLFTAALAGCRERHRPAPPIEPAPEATIAASKVDAAPPPAPPCEARRPFGERAELALPPPFEGFSPCDALAVVFPDYDRDAASSATAGGKVRIDLARRWETGGRALLALVYYTGGDAEADFVCGQCRVAAHVAVVERRGPSLALVAKGKDPWQPNVDALFDGRAELDATAYPFDETETLLALRRPWSTGMPGYWTQVSFYRLEGATLAPVMEYGVEWYASGMGKEDDDVVRSTPSFEARAGGPRDVRWKTTEERCHRDYDKADAPLVCKPARPVGAERWRFDGKEYKRVEGKSAPLPGVLHRLWGW